MTVTPPKPSPVDDTGHPFLQLPGILGQAGITPLLMRDDIDTVAGLSEADVLVPPTQIDEAVVLLQAGGWELFDTGLFHVHKRALVRLVEGSLLKIDLHGQYIDDGIVYMSEEHAFALGRRHASGYLLPSDEVWLLHVILHLILAKPEIPAKYRERLGVVLPRSKRAEVLRMADGYALSYIVGEAMDLIASRSWSPDMLSHLRGRLVRKLLTRFPGNLARWLRQRLIWLVGRPFGWRRGFLIAVIGPDGAGKSTFIGELSKQLAAWQVPVRQVYLGPWERPILPTTRYLRYLGADPHDTLQGTDSSVPLLRRISKLVKGYLKRYAYYAAAFSEIWARHLRLVLPQLLLRRVVLSDRYAYDLEIGYYNHPVSNSQSLRRLIVRCSPKPSMTILLDNDPEVIWARKQEYPLPLIRGALERYRALAAREGFEVLNTSTDAGALVRELLARRWRDMVRWRRDRVWPAR